MRVTRWFGRGVGCSYNTWFNTRWSSRGWKGARVPHPPAAPPTFVARTHARRRTRRRRIKRRRRLSNVSHITERRRRRRWRREGRHRLTCSHIRESHPKGKAVDIQPDPGAAARRNREGERGSRSSASPAPPAPWRPGVPGERFFGELVFPGVQLLDRGHWVPQRLPRAGRRHHARAPRRCFGGWMGPTWASILVASDLAALNRRMQSSLVQEIRESDDAGDLGTIAKVLQLEQVFFC